MLKYWITSKYLFQRPEDYRLWPNYHLQFVCQSTKQYAHNLSPVHSAYSESSGWWSFRCLYTLHQSDWHSVRPINNISKWWVYTHWFYFDFIFGIWINLVGIGNVNSGHVKSCLIQSRTFAQFLYDLHHHSVITQIFDRNCYSIF